MLDRKAAQRWAVRLCAAVLVVGYGVSYLGNPGLPGRSARVPEGWWAWFDQGKTLASARAFAALDLSAAAHWYSPGYSLLGAPFVALGFVAHPFVLVDLACLLLTFWAFIVFARGCGAPRGVAACVFVAAVLWNGVSFGEWAIPWNSTPAAALVWGVLAVCGAWLKGLRRPALLGVLVGVVPMFRPTELLPVAACVAWVLVATWRAEGVRAGPLMRLAAGAACGLVPYGALHLAIYGAAPSEYMAHSREVGFTLHDFGWKAYVVLADPYEWFTDGPGLLRRLPWMALGFAGMVPALVRGRAAGMLAAALLVHMALYVSYLDLLPLGLFRYGNVHYWKWAIPGFALLAWLLVAELAGWRRAPAWAAAGGLVLVGLLSLIRVTPVAVTGPAKMVELHGDPPTFGQSYFGAIVVYDALGRLRGEGQIRAFPVRGGMRVVGLVRDLEGAVTVDPTPGLSAALLAAAPARFGERVTLGRPCWLMPCGQRVRNDLLPSAPGTGP